MKKRYMMVGVVAALLGSMTLSSCIGSFRLTNSVLKWNKRVGNKFVNELVFFAFWVLPVYEVTSLADILVLNSIEFWSGRNPLTSSTKVVDTDHGRYEIICDGKGYTVTHKDTGRNYRLDFAEETQTWSLEFKGETYPLMTYIDENTIQIIAPEGDMRVVNLTEDDVLAYENSVRSQTFLRASAL